MCGVPNVSRDLPAEYEMTTTYRASTSPSFLAISNVRARAYIASREELRSARDVLAFACILRRRDYLWVFCRLRRRPELHYEVYMVSTTTC